MENLVRRRRATLLSSVACCCSLLVVESDAFVPATIRTPHHDTSLRVRLRRRRKSSQVSPTAPSSLKKEGYPYSLGRFTYVDVDEDEDEEQNMVVSDDRTIPEVTSEASTSTEIANDHVNVEARYPNELNSRTDEIVNGTKNREVEEEYTSPIKTTTNTATTRTTPIKKRAQSVKASKQQMDSLLNTTLGPLNENAQQFMKAWKTATKWQIPYYDYAMFTKASPTPSTPGTAGKVRKGPTITTSSIIPPSGRTSQDVVTIQDLDEILRLNGYVKRDELTQNSLLQAPNDNALPRIPYTVSKNMMNGAMNPSSTRAKSTVAGSGVVAFPQASVMSNRDVQIGTTVASTFVGIVVASTILPNLWLMGIFAGALYGYSVSRPGETAINRNTLATLMLSLGKRLAKCYLQVYDFFSGVWFMYKTGQLSYDYYKRYAQLDQRFALTDKIDAWNARFQQGKVNFDKWEQENEVGRKILAGLRTIWLVEEKSLKRGRGKAKSRYRLLQFGFDVVAWFQRLMVAWWKVLTGGASTETLDLLRGIRMAILDRDDLGPRMGAAFVLLCLINATGALFAVSPNFLGCIAILIGLVWPSWTVELRERLTDLQDELQLQGQKDQNGTNTHTTTSSNNRGSSSSATKAKPRSRLLTTSRHRYSYFTRNDGSKRWYRTGQSQFSRKPTKKNKKGKTSIRPTFPIAFWKDRNSSQRKNPEWGLFSRKSD